MPRLRYYFSLWVIIVAIAVIFYYGLIYFANLAENTSLLIAIGFILVLAIVFAIFPPRLLRTRERQGEDEASGDGDQQDEHEEALSAGILSED